MNFRRLASFMLLGCAFGGAMTAAFADTLKDIKARGSITIGVDFTHPPYGMLDAQSQRSGTDYEIAQLIAHDMGVKLNVLPVTGPNRIPFLLTNKADMVVASFSVTDERKKVIAFTVPYATEPVLVLAPGKNSVKSALDLQGKSVAVARGTTADIDLTTLLKNQHIDGVTIVRYLDEATTRTAVQSGQQDYMVASLADALSVKNAVPQKHLEYQFQLSDDPLAIGLRQNDQELTDWLNAWIGANLKNGRLNSIWVKYFGISLPKSMTQ